MWKMWKGSRNKNKKIVNAKHLKKIKKNFFRSQRTTPHNIPVGKQYPTTLWMQRNSDEIIQYSRKSNAIAVGSVFPFDSTVVPPPLATVSCTRSSCKMVPTGAEGGIGVERHENEFPELFGTFSSESRFSSAKKADHTELTSHYQGGRNTIHRDKNISSAYY